MIGPWPEIRSGMLSFNSLTDSVSVAPRVDCMTTKVAIAGPVRLGHLHEPRDDHRYGRGNCCVNGVCDQRKVLLVPSPEFHK